MVDVEDCALPGHQLVLKSYDRLGRALRRRRLGLERRGHAPQLLAQLQLAAAALSVGCGRSGSCDKARYCFISATIAVRVLITRACKR